MAHRQPVVAWLAIQGLTIAQAARETGLHRTTIEKSVRCERPPSPRFVDWSVRRFGVPADVLFHSTANAEQESAPDQGDLVWG